MESVDFFLFSFSLSMQHIFVNSTDSFRNSKRFRFYVYTRRRINRKARKSFESRALGGNDAWNEKSSKEGNGICVLSFERIPPSRGCTSFRVTSSLGSLSSIRSANNFSTFSNPFSNQRDLFKKERICHFRDCDSFDSSYFVILNSLPNSFPLMEKLRTRMEEDMNFNIESSRNLY